jgi:hypothetical protein
MPETRCRELLAIFLDFFHLFRTGRKMTSNSCMCAIRHSAEPWSSRRKSASARLSSAATRGGDQRDNRLRDRDELEMNYASIKENVLREKLSASL